MAQAASQPPATAPPQPDQPTQAPEPDDHGLLAALVLILGAAITAGAAEALVAKALAPIGVSAQAASAAYRLAMAASLPTATKTQAVSPTAAAAKSWRAAYLLAAAKRLARGVQNGNFSQALANERRYAVAHRAAQANRVRVAQTIQALADEHGDWLQWNAHKPMDARVTPECRAADGKLFRVSQPPAIGYPGAAHRHCRCFPSAPSPRARVNGVTVDEAVIAAGASVGPGAT